MGYTIRTTQCVQISLCDVYVLTAIHATCSFRYTIWLPFNYIEGIGIAMLVVLFLLLAHTRMLVALWSHAAEAVTLFDHRNGGLESS